MRGQHEPYPDPLLPHPEMQAITPHLPAAQSCQAETQKPVHDGVWRVFQVVPELQGTCEAGGGEQMNLHEWSWIIGATAVIGVLGFVFWSMMVVAKRDDEHNEMVEREARRHGLVD